MSPPTASSSLRAPQPLSLKAKIKRRLQSVPFLWGAYWRTKQELKRFGVLRYFLYDIRQTYKSMFWAPGQREHEPLSAELLFQYHKLEKGLSMPGPRRFFGAEPALATTDLVRRWIDAGHRRDDPVFLGALETLHAYLDRIDAPGSVPHDEIGRVLRQVLSEAAERAPSLATPQILANPMVESGASPAEAFRALAIARRSVRDFRADSVDESILLDALAIAQLSPSACNRQPWFVYIVNEKMVQSEILKYQNGNRGFGHLVPHVAVITADESCFFDASERHEPYIDGGLFAMSFVLALRAHGVGSCCLNWCVPPSHDVAVHRILEIPACRRIIMLLAIGYPVEECVVPRSPRRGLEDVIARV